MEKYQLTETIYSSKNYDGELESQKEQFQDFLQEVLRRKRGDNPKDELQAVMLITPTAWAAKINERDGYALHSYANMNLVRYLNNNPNYFKEDDCEELMEKEEKTRTIYQDVHVVISAGEDECLILMNTFNQNLNSFQISWLKEIIEESKKTNPTYSMLIGFSGLGTTIEEDQIDEIQEEKLLNLFSQFEEKANHK